jgi:hypothetical protein
MEELARWQLFKFVVGEDPFDIFDVLLEAEAKKQFRGTLQTQECSIDMEMR